VNHAGTVITTGKSAEDNGIRLGHYPQAYSVYNMMGGTLVVGADYDLSCATDGQGWFNMTGGEVFATRVMLNERDSTGGYGRLTVAGGVMNIGSLSGLVQAVSNGITADRYAPYLVEFGGAGGVIRAQTNLDISVGATLYGTGADAITFDTQEWTVTMTNKLSGVGGFNKSGSGLLTLGCPNSFSGGAAVVGGALLLEVPDALTNTAVSVGSGALLDLGGLSQRVAGLGGDGTVSNGTLTVAGAITPGTNGVGVLTLAALGSAAPGGALTVDVTTNGTCDVLRVLGSLDLTGMTLEVTDTEQLNTHQNYTIVTCTGPLTGKFEGANNLPGPWYVLYDGAGKTVQLSAKNGTLIRVK
jgi:autotransporter-associated beta strand protein